MAMENLDHPSRREFVQRVAAAAGAIGVSGMSGLLAFQGSGPSQRPKPDAILVELLDGNQRFVAGKLLHPGRARKTSWHWQKGRLPAPSSSAVPIHGWHRN